MKELFLKVKKDYMNVLKNTIVPSETYHLEDDTWSHTCMVFSQAKSEFMKKVALLHDLGKPVSKFINENGRVLYTGHEHFSTLIAIDYLMGDKGYLSVEDIDILYTINYHGALWQKSERQIRQYFKHNLKLLKNLYEFRKYDTAGNICFEDQEGRDVKVELEKIEMPKKDPNKPTIHLFIGLPGCGKSTYIKENLNGLHVLSRDDILLEYGKDKFNETDYNEIWKKLSKEDHKEIDKLFEVKKGKLLKARKDFVVDRTNMSIKSRRKFFNKNFNTKMYVSLIGLDELEKRNKKRGDKNLFYLWSDMGRGFELPLLGEDDSVYEIEYIF